jgi:hypothetical protein
MWPFKKKKPQPLAVAQAQQIVEPPRCFVLSILNDLKNPENWTFKYTGDWYATCKDRAYQLYVSHRYNDVAPYVALSDLILTDVGFTDHERKLVEEAVFIVWKDYQSKQKKIRIEDGEKKLRELFPECYPKQGGVEMMN